jgi:hypothetical protein
VLPRQAYNKFPSEDKMSEMFKIKILNIEDKKVQLEITKTHPDATNLKIDYDEKTGRVSKHAKFGSGYDEVNRLLARTLIEASSDNTIKAEYPAWNDEGVLFPFIDCLKVLKMKSIFLPEIMKASRSEQTKTLKQFFLDKGYAAKLVTKNGGDETSHELYWEQASFEITVKNKKYLSHLTVGLTYDSAAFSY